MIITNQIVRDHLTFKGAKNLQELVESLNLNLIESNTVQAALIELEQLGAVKYNIATGQWISLIVLE